MEKASIKNINFLEENTLKYSKEHLHDVLEYFEFLQETLLFAFHNSGNLLTLKDIPNNQRLLAYVSTARAFSISKVAMDMTIRGYPLEGMSLSRTLAELTRCADYLLRHENLIDQFLTGKLKLTQVLKKSKNETENERKYLFGHMWGFMSRFAHATSDWIVLPLRPKAHNRISVELVNNNPDEISAVAKVISAELLFQYFVFRIFFVKDLSVVDELKKRDAVLFDPENVRKLGNVNSDHDNALAEIYDFVMQIYDNKSSEGDSSA